MKKFTKIGKRKVPLIVKDIDEVSSEEVTNAMLTHGAVIIKHPDFDKEKNRKRKKIKKVI